MYIYRRVGSLQNTAVFLVATLMFLHRISIVQTHLCAKQELRKENDYLLMLF